MRNKVQLMAVLLGLAFVVPNANAAMTNTSSGDSSLILTLISGNSATFDLGFNYSNFSSELFALSNANPGGQYYTWDLANDSNYAGSWASFVAGKDLTSVNWGIFAGDNTGTGAGARGLVSTYVGGSTNLSTFSLINLVANANAYYDVNNTLGSHSTNANGSSLLTGSWIYQAGTTLLGGTSIQALSGLDVGMTFVNLTSASAGLALAKAQISGSFPAFTLSSSGILTYWNGRLSPIPEVPEADTWSMMLLGLGAIAGLSRMGRNKPSSRNAIRRL